MEFKIKKIWDCYPSLEIEFVYIIDGVFVHEKRCATEISKKFHMLDCIFVQTPIDCGMKLETEESDKIINSTLNKQILVSLRF